MRLGRTFFTLYFMIVAMFLVFTWLLDEAWSSYIEQDVESYTGYKTMLTAVGDYLQNHPKERWPIILENAAKRYELDLSLVHINDLEPSALMDYEKLEKGNTRIFYYGDEVILHHLLDNKENLITLGPAKMPTRPRAEAFIRVLVYAVLAMVIFIWLWPMSRDLDALKKTAVAFGSGDFDSQAPQAKSTIMDPMVNSFNMMASRIKRLIEAHKELTNAVAHELRTPLARSKFALQMFSAASSKEKQAQYIKQIESDINELDELINEMLLYASFDNDTPELKFERQNINELTRNLLKQFDHYSGEITLIASKDNIEADCDFHFIERAIQNYISNAIKYGRDRIELSLSVVDEQCLICVEDNGSGVSQAFKNTVFDAFSRGDNSRNRETGGFGLGLAIVGRIIQWHGGNVAVDDSALGGAKFSLAWPINKAVNLVNVKAV